MQKFYTNYLTKFSTDLNGILCTLEICLCDEPHTHFVSSIQYSRERIILA